MATDRERAASLYREARNAGPGDGPRVVSMIERALTPTDEEREVIEAARSLDAAREGDAAIPRTHSWRDVVNAGERLHTALARLDAATGGRGDG